VKFFPFVFKHLKQSWVRTLSTVLAMATGLERLRVRSGSVVHNIGAIVLTAIAGVIAVFGVLLLENPLMWHIDVGGPIFNLVLLGYALPAVLMLVLSYTCLAMAVKVIPLAVAYGAWESLGLVLITLCSAWLFAEELKPIKLAAIALIIAGIVLLERGTDEAPAESRHAS